MKKKFILCAQPLTKVTIGKELHSELMLQSSIIGEYKRLGATTILGHKKDTIKNFKLANAYAIEFTGLTPSKNSVTLQNQINNWNLPSGFNVEDLIQYVLGRMWWRERNNGRTDNILNIESDLDEEDDEINQKVDGSFNPELPITRNNFPKAPVNYFFNGFMCWMAFSQFTCENPKYVLTTPESDDVESEKKNKSRAMKRKKLQEEKSCQRDVANAQALRAKMELPYGMSFMDTIKAKGINVKSVEVKQRSQSTLLTSLTKQQPL